jgi:hypothetical protein
VTISKIGLAGGGGGRGVKVRGNGRGRGRGTYEIPEMGVVLREGTDVIVVVLGEIHIYFEARVFFDGLGEEGYALYHHRSILQESYLGRGKGRRREEGGQIIQETEEGRGEREEGRGEGRGKRGEGEGEGEGRGERGEGRGERVVRFVP